MHVRECANTECGVLSAGQPRGPSEAQHRSGRTFMASGPSGLGEAACVPRFPRVNRCPTPATVPMVQLFRACFAKLLASHSGLISLGSLPPSASHSVSSYGTDGLPPNCSQPAGGLPS